jgi:hypothetical protein
MKKIVMMILPMFTAFTRSKAQTVSYLDTAHISEYKVAFISPTESKFSVPVYNGADEKCFVEYRVNTQDLNEEEKAYVSKIKTVIDLSTHSERMFKSPYTRYSWQPISIFVFKRKSGDIGVWVEGTSANDYGTKRKISFWYDIDQNTKEIKFLFSI